ncbi:oligosaccharide flippase family protein [Methanomassiliicoccaceae archaeon COG_1]|nr:oligosaccharide flippase family protein [Methanomassiliicoccaceae archaeon COG_1]
MVGDKSFRTRTPLNAAVNVARTAVMALVGILLVPFYLDSLGLATYGIIPLATTMTSYVMILADSLGIACSRYATLAIHNEPNASRTISTAFYGLVRACLVIMPIVLLLAYLSPEIFGVSDNSYADVRMMFLLIFASSMIVAVTSALTSVFNAFNNLYQLYLARLAYTLVQVGLIFFLFTFDTPSLVTVGVSYLLSSMLLFIIICLLAKRSYPQLSLRYRDYDRKQFKKMSNLGTWTVVIRIGNMLYIQASLVIINMYLGAEYSGGFSIISSLISMIHTACYSVTAAFDPLVYICYAKKDYKQLYKLVRTGMKFVAFLFAMPVAFVIVFSPEILTAWVGSRYTEDPYNLQELVVIALLPDVAYCAATMLQSLPEVYLKVKELAKYTVLFGVVNVTLSVCVTWYTDWGVKGVTAVWAASMAAYTIATIVFNERITGFERFSLAKPVAFGYMAMAFLCAVFYAMSRFVDLPGQWAPIIAVFLILFGAYMFVLSRMMKESEKEMVATFMPEFLVKVFRPLLRRGPRAP